VKILLPAYRSLGWIVKPYAIMHEKYWGEPVVLLAEEDYSEGYFDFASPPWREDLTWIDGKVPCEIPAHHFTDVLIWYLKQIGDQHVIIMLADYLLTAPVDKARILQLQEYMELDDHILRGHIDYGGGFYAGDMTDTYKNLEIWEGQFLPTSLTPAIWNRKLLLEMMHPREDAQRMELSGRNAFLLSNYRSVAAKPGMVYYINCIRGRDMSHMIMTRDLYAEIGQYLRIPVYDFID
jgi:hypothetical protein